MKSYKIFSILLILIIVFSLSITGCSPEPEVIDSENQEEDTSSDQEDEEDNELSEEDKQEENEKDNKELEESENEKTDSEKDQTEEDKALEESENSEEANDENEIKNEYEEEVTDGNSDSEDSSSDDTTSEEVSPESEENNQNEEINLLKIEGNVENSLSLSLDDLKAMEDFIFSGTFYSLNSFGTTEYTDFTGVKLWNLLKEEALISEEAAKVKVIAVDGYSMEFTAEQIKRDDYIDETNQDLKLPVIIAWKENGEEYNPEEGPPYKLVIGQKEPGDVNKPQWVRDIDKIIVE